MKRVEYRQHQTFDDAAKNAAASFTPPPAPTKRIVAALLLAAILACAEREFGGATDGSLVSVFTGHLGDGLHHLLSILLNRGP